LGDAHRSKMRAENLTSEARSVIMFLHKEGYSIRNISAVSKAKTNVHYIVKKVMETGSVADRPGIGRARISTPRDDKALIRTFSQCCNCIIKMQLG